MRIIGGHDYYDSGLAYGRDDAVIFLRSGDRRATTLEMHERFHLPYAYCAARIGRKDQTRARQGQFGRHELGSVETWSEGRTLRHEVSHATVILCGRLHRGVHIKTTEPYGISRGLGERWIWNADALRAFATDNGLELDEGSNGIRQGWASHEVAGGGRRIDAQLQDLATWFEPVALAGPALDAFVSQRVTIASMNPLEYPPHNQVRQALAWRIDQPSLAEMEFAKAVDPYTAFQEIAMWKGGVLPSDGPPVVEITDDKVKIAKAGFHHPTSFRRAKQD